jgi:hypothetical protein
VERWGSAKGSNWRYAVPLPSFSMHTSRYGNASQADLGERPRRGPAGAYDMDVRFMRGKPPCSELVAPSTS